MSGYDLFLDRLIRGVIVAFYVLPGLLLLAWLMRGTGKKKGAEPEARSGERSDPASR